MTQQPNLVLRSGEVSIEIARPGSREEHLATRFSALRATREQVSRR
ncbi:MAG: hypothetical protein ACOC2D_15180 [Spirochaetota bacterium]